MAHSYDGGRHARAKSIQTLTLISQTAIRSDRDVINSMGDIIDEDLPKKVLKNTTQRLSEADVLGERDCCVFKKFVALQGLKSPPPFLRIETIHFRLTLYIACEVSIVPLLLSLSQKRGYAISCLSERTQRVCKI